MRDYNNKSLIVSNSILFKKKFLISNKQARCEMFVRSCIDSAAQHFLLRSAASSGLHFFCSSHKVSCKLFSLSVEIVMQILMHWQEQHFMFVPASKKLKKVPPPPPPPPPSLSLSLSLSGKEKAKKRCFVDSILGWCPVSGDLNRCGEKKKNENISPLWRNIKTFAFVGTRSLG